uniref:Phosphoinositide phosphatase SAC9 n=1 Tax=Ananas comosus var. bracteatus TaxID=296719 RepID=A0A6V7NJJ2_ANACO|nr:unnamed protein product [Ananas comosus var. bracteatus]
MKLEIERLRLNLSSVEKDRGLLSISIDPATINPYILVDDSYILRLCNYADTLALLGHAAFEDQINASIELDIVDESVVDFWNINEFGETCSGGKCEVRAGTSSKVSFTNSSSTSSPLFLECSQCERKACKICCAGMALLLNNSFKDAKIYSSLSSPSGSVYGAQCEVSNYNLALKDGVVCKNCCSDLILHALYVDYVRVLSSLRRKNRADSAACKALDQVFGHEFSRLSSSLQGIASGKMQLKKLLNGAESLAEFPTASLLNTVETAAGSEPLFSLLSPLGFGEQHSYWKAPSSLSSVEFSVVLSSLSDVSGVAIIVSSCGYTKFDCPIVQIWASNKIHREERSFIGKWDVKELIASSPHLYGPDNSSSMNDVPRNIKFFFPNPIRCCIIWMTLTIPQLGSSLAKFDEEFNLLSLDEDSFPETASSLNVVETQNSSIHVKRIVVFGKSLRRDAGQDMSTQGPEMMRLRSFLDRPPQLSRFRIPIEAERLTNNDHVLEQYLSPTVPELAGFRIDAFNVIKPRVTHSPSSNADLWESSLTCLEDRFILPAVLYIQVSAVQVT